MRFFRWPFVIWILSAAAFCFDKPEEWLPVTQQDMQITSVPGYRDLPALQLYLDYYKDENGKFETVYRRIKILKDSAVSLANVEIRIEPHVTLESLAARTIHPDGTIVEFSGQPLDKIIVRTREFKFAAKTLYLPEVTVGSIIEYRYKLTLPSGIVSAVTTWPIQDELYTLRAHFRFRAFQGVVSVPSEQQNLAQHSRVNFAYLNQIDANIPEKKKDNLMEMEVQNIPPFQTEEFMPPADDYKPTVLFYYGGRDAVSQDEFWRQTSKGLAEWTNKFIGDRREIHDLAGQTIGGETEPEKKVRLLYARVQQLRNLSYERDRTDEELKRENLKPARDVVEVLNRGYGWRNQINRVFAALARAAGFEASVVFVTNRRNRSFIKGLLLLDQFDSQVVMVKINDKDRIFDPGTKFCPFGVLRWANSGTLALKLGTQAEPEFIKTPEPASSVERRVAHIELAADGSARGDASLELNSVEALESRIESLETDATGRNKVLESLLQSWLPEGAVVKLVDSQGWESVDRPLSARFTIEIPSLASVTAKRLVAPALLFHTISGTIFTNEVRRYPIIFPYPVSEIDEVSIKLPSGYSLEAPPYRRKLALSYAGYEVSSELEGDRLVTKRLFRLDEFSFPIEKYYELRNFFDIVRPGDGGQAVLHQIAQPADH